ncbi:MAG: M20/M25/M40 family metallo-hydrolase [Planctomycetota bacterium]|nr:M20/M25/M40 family metallo-hydrolase [Planctomycetota bacterium]
MTRSLSEREQRVSRLLESRGPSMVEDLARHVAIPTGKGHSEGLDAYRGILRRRVEALGAEVEIIAGQERPSWLYGAADGAPPPSAVCRRLREGMPRVLIACHLDTVFDPHGAFREMHPASDGSTARGPGVIDMKGGVLIALNALEALEEAGVRVGWTLLLTSDEETGSYCSEHVIRAEAAGHDVGLATEPALPGGELAVERMGSGQFCLEAWGRSAHVGRAFSEGISAVTALAEAILGAAAIADPEAGRIVSIGPLEGNSATNAVPDHARAWGNVRYPTREKADEIGRMLEALERNAEDEGALPRVVAHRSLNRPAKPLTPEVERLALMARGSAESLGQSLPFASTGGVCDGNIMQDAGLATIDTLGVRGGGMHTDREWIEMRSLVERSQLFAVLMSRLSEEWAG